VEVLLGVKIIPDHFAVAWWLLLPEAHFNYLSQFPRAGVVKRESSLSQFLRQHSLNLIG